MKDQKPDEEKKNKFNYKFTNVFQKTQGENDKAEQKSDTAENKSTLNDSTSNSTINGSIISESSSLNISNSNTNETNEGNNGFTSTVNKPVPLTPNNQLSAPTVNRPKIPQIPSVAVAPSISKPQIPQVPVVPGAPSTNPPNIPQMPSVSGGPSVNQPSIPQIPTVPGVPSVNKPSIPQIPSIPGVTAVPSINKPSIPQIPSIPGVTAVPSVNKPSIPQIPGVPGVTAVPSVNKPSIPQILGMAGVPAIPSGVKPSIPQIPGVSGVPSVNRSNLPQIPGVPGVPSVNKSNVSPIPGVPGMPRVPGVPGVPGVPRVPGVPGAPGAPGARPGPPMPGMNVERFTLPPKEKKRPCNTMKNFMWNIIEPRLLKNSIWLELDDSKVEINSLVFEREFSQKQTTKIVEVIPESQKKAKKTYFEDSKDLQVMNILISKYKLDYVDVIENLYTYNGDYFTRDLCIALLAKIPKGEAMRKIPLIPDDSPEFEQLETADQIVQIFKKIKCSELRLKVIVFDHSYEEDCTLVIKSGKKLLSIIKFFMQSKSFRRWLEYILAYGNYMNGISMRGGAYAFKLDTLNKLTETKSNDGSKSLLQYIIEAIGNNEKDFDLLNFHFELDILDSVSFNGFCESHESIKEKFEPVTQLSKEYIEKNEEFVRLDVDEEDEEEGDLTGEFIEKLLPEAQPYLEECQKLKDSILENYKQFMAFMGEDANKLKFEEFIQLMLKFRKDLEIGKRHFVDQLSKKKKDKEKRKSLLKPNK